MTKNKKVLLANTVVLALSLLALLCYAQEENNLEKKKGYVITPNNKLEITVYGEPDLSVTVQVAQDGLINYPFLGSIKAAGLTAKELEKNITIMLAEDYLVAPQVTIVVKEYPKISIFGQVKSPGSFEYKENLTLTQIVAHSGGFDQTANLTKVKIIRVIGDKKEILEVNLEQILEKAAPDVEIKPNDTIVVEEYGHFTLLGQVGRPGVYSIKRNLRVMEAISLAGGLGPTAAPNATRVIRVENGQKKIIRVPIADIMKGASSEKDILLKNGDTVVVSESFF